MSETPAGSQVLQGFLATTHELPGRRFRHTRESLAQLRAATLAGDVPMGAHHDPRHPARGRLRLAELRATDDGDLGLWIEVDVTAEELAAIGDVKAFSPTILEAFLRSGEAPSDVGVYGEEYWYDRSDIEGALELLVGADLNARVGYAHQHSFIPPAAIIVQLSVPFVMDLGPAVAGAAVWDAVKYLWARVRQREGAVPPATSAIVIEVGTIRASIPTSVWTR